MDEQSNARAKRVKFAAKYRPTNVRLLLVAESPPSSLDRYFYFEDVSQHDGLFRYVCLGVLGETPDRNEKPPYLTRLRDAGVFLIDVALDPQCRANARQLMPFIPALIQRCLDLRPKQVVLIKASVYDAAHEPLRAAGLPVLDARIPFPGSGQQRRFEEAFGRALNEIGWPTPSTPARRTTTPRRRRRARASRPR